VLGIIEIGSHELFAHGWLQTMNLLINSSDYRCEPPRLAYFNFFIGYFSSIVQYHLDNGYYMMDFKNSQQYDLALWKLHMYTKS
jgi:hypothetical protein